MMYQQKRERTARELAAVRHLIPQHSTGKMHSAREVTDSTFIRQRSVRSWTNARSRRTNRHSQQRNR